MKRIGYLVLFCVLIMSFMGCSQRTSKNSVSYLPFRSEVDERWGLIDWKGNPIIENEFQNQPSCVTEGCFYVINEEELYEFYTADKKFKKIGKEYIDVGHFHDGLAPVVEKDQPVSFIRSDGTVAFTFDKYKNESIKSVSEFKEGRARFKTASSKYGFIDTKGKVIIEPIYDGVELFHNNAAYVYKLHEGNKEAFIIDKNGKEYFKVNPDYKYVSKVSEDLMTYFEMNKENDYLVGVLNRNGEKVIKSSSKYSKIGMFENGFAVFENQNGECGLLNRKGDIIIRAKYNSLVLCNDILIFSENGKWGLLDLEGNTVLKPEYDDIIPFNDTYTYARDNNEWVVINKKGEEIKIETTIEELNRDNEGYRYYGDVESDYVDIQEEVNNVMELINNDGSIDKLTYKTTPEEFANIYNEKYNASDLKDQTSIYHNLYGYDYFDLTVGIKYNQLVILPKYEQKWKESYWGNGYWDKELSGYYYNPDAISDTFYLNFIPKEKLKDKGKQVLDLVCQYLTEKGYTKLSTDDNNNEHISIFWEKKSPFIIKAGVHFYPKDNRIGIAIGKDK